MQGVQNAFIAGQWYWYDRVLILPPEWDVSIKKGIVNHPSAHASQNPLAVMSISAVAWDKGCVITAETYVDGQLGESGGGRSNISESLDIPMDIDGFTGRLMQTSI